MILHILAGMIKTIHPSSIKRKEYELLPDASLPKYDKYVKKAKRTLPTGIPTRIQPIIVWVHNDLSS
jgi:hypothetical protein